MRIFMQIHRFMNVIKKSATEFDITTKYLSQQIFFAPSNFL